VAVVVSRYFVYPRFTPSRCFTLCESFCIYFNFVGWDSFEAALKASRKESRFFDFQMECHSQTEWDGGILLNKEAGD
jgi:hypothetical protein